jgi:hypothetical protein
MRNEQVKNDKILYKRSLHFEGTASHVNIIFVGLKFKCEIVGILSNM